MEQFRFKHSLAGRLFLALSLPDRFTIVWGIEQRGGEGGGSRDPRGAATGSITLDLASRRLSGLPVSMQRY